MKHEYLTVGARRWCMGCNTYQVFRGGRWVDGQPDEPWPGYEKTQPECPRTSPLTSPEHEAPR